MVPRNPPIAQVMGVTNAVAIDAEAIAPITLVGPGAGGVATASAVVADIADIARGVRAPPFGRPAARLTHEPQGADAAPRGRLLHPPAGARPAGHRRDHRAAAGRAEHLAGIDRAAPSRRRPHGGDEPGRAGEPVPVILITYATTEDAVRRALAAVRRDGVIAGQPQVIRIEKN